MAQELTPLPESVVNKLAQTGDLSGLTETERTQYMTHRCKMNDLDPAGMPFTLIKQPQKDGPDKVILYANKECAAQLSSRRKLPAVCVKEEVLFDGAIFKATFEVTDQDGRKTQECGSVSLNYFDKNGKGWQRLGGDGLSNAIVKAYTKAKRRAILSHCGLGISDESEEFQREEIKPATATVKMEPLVVPDTAPATKPGILYAEGGCGHVEEGVSNGKKAWKVIVGGGEYMTRDALFAEAAKIHADNCCQVKVSYEVTPSGKNKLLSIVEVPNV